VNGGFGQASGKIGFVPSASYFLHVLDLRPETDHIFRSFDKDSVQRRIHRAERAGLVAKCGRSEDLLQEFYSLFVATRSRHRLPPIPYSWFRNLIQCQGEALEIRLAYKNKNPISAILTLRFKNVVYYKYGCSDVMFNNFGATPWLLWQAVVSAKSNGALEFNLGRTEEDNPGLLKFKNHWVSRPRQLLYWRFPNTPSLDSVNDWKLRAAKRVFACMPESLLRVTGKMIYRHFG
jgi:lipid II:glycine glycyltransferase (peptidoglycan interpeptide bridge formation enzyme)